MLLLGQSWLSRVEKAVRSLKSPQALWPTPFKGWKFNRLCFDQHSFRRSRLRFLKGALLNVCEHGHLRVRDSWIVRDNKVFVEEWLSNWWTIVVSRMLQLSFSLNRHIKPFRLVFPSVLVYLCQLWLERILLIVVLKIFVEFNLRLLLDELMVVLIHVLHKTWIGSEVAFLSDL